MDPYKVLGVSPTATDEEVKRAYRELARKYHPDNYVNNPLADLAKEKMQEINSAYDTIMKQRRSGSSYSASTSGPSYGGGTGSARSQQYSGYSGPNASIYTQVRNAINVGNVSLAEELLSRVSQRDAEWHYLRSNVCYRKGWFDEAMQEINQACAMAPGNSEYERMRTVLSSSQMYGGYRPTQQSDALDCCAQLLCLNCLCNCCGGGGC